MYNPLKNKRGKIMCEILKIPPLIEFTRLMMVM
jgi:hypothetical protein